MNHSIKENKLQLKKIRYKSDAVKDIKTSYFISNEMVSPVIPVKKGDKINLNVLIAEVRTLPSYIGPLKF